MKGRVLFIDDDPRILEGLRHRLRPQRAEWEMSFVRSGREALRLLSTEPIDVIVSDVRMPEMDGAALFTRVQAEHPGVARIVLSGYAEADSAVRVAAVAHQCLVKPCDAGLLENVVERAFGLRKLLTDDAVRSIVGGIEKLPPLPCVYMQLTAAVSNVNAPINDICRILKQDMALCAKLLQIVNSAFFRLGRTITRVEDAVAHLGTNFIRQIVLSAEVFQYSRGRRPSLPFGTLQAHALLVGTLSSGLLPDKQQKEEGFVVGLLHDIGKLVLATELPDYLDQVLREMKRSGCSMHSVEMSISGVSHAEIGAYLLGLWGLPHAIVEAVANHHDPTRVDAREFEVLAAAHIADALIHEETPSDPAGSGQPPMTLDLAYVEALGVSDRLPAWRDLAREVAATSIDGGRL